MATYSAFSIEFDKIYTITMNNNTISEAAYVIIPLENVNK